MNSKTLLDEILKDKELAELVETLTDEEIEDNILVLYNQKKENDLIKKNKGLSLNNDDTYYETYLEKQDGRLVQKYRVAKKQASMYEGLYMPFDASTGDLYLDPARKELFDSMKEVKGTSKGLYVYGKFGTGKTYLMMKLAKELSKKQKTIYVYYPEYLNNIKAEIAKGGNVDRLIEKLKTVDVLFIDDIGREQNTVYNRDQVLGVIINYRYQYKLQTFMTSNYDIEMLDNHLAETNDKIDRVKSGAITDRIRHMMKQVELEGKDYR